MSGSNKKKDKASSPEEAMKKQRSQRRETEEKKKQTMYTVIGSVVAILVIGLVIWNQGFFQRSAAAFTIDGTKYTAAQVQLYYTDALYGALMGNYTQEEGGVAYDMSTPNDEQAYSATMTWHDFFAKEATLSLAELHLLGQAAKDAGFTLPAEAQADLEAVKSSLETAWVGRTTSKSSYLRLQYNMTEAEYLAMTELELLANYYQDYVYDSFEFTDGEYETYYEENQDSLDVITFSQFVFSAVPEISYDEEGNALEMTEEETAIFEGAKTMASYYGDMVLAALNEGATVEEIMEEYGEFATTYQEHVTKPTASIVASDSANTWLLSQEREEGEVELSVDSVSDTVYFTVNVYEGRDRASDKVANIRHVLIPANSEENTSEATEEQWAAAETQAQELLDLWVSEGADPTAFSALATEYSADSSSASVGGVMENVTIYDGLATEFQDWTFDSSRSTGDYGIVKNTQSATQGWHLMYFDDWGLPLWEHNAKINLSNDSLTQWAEALLDGVENRVVYGPAMEYVEVRSLF